jgi:hypothetical protein
MTRGGPPAWWLGVGLTALHCKKFAADWLKSYIMLKYTFSAPRRCMVY